MLPVRTTSVPKRRSSDLRRPADGAEIDGVVAADLRLPVVRHHLPVRRVVVARRELEHVETKVEVEAPRRRLEDAQALRHDLLADAVARSEEHTSELQSLMRISYAVFCLKKNKTTL